jgi:hypothetical protein
MKNNINDLMHEKSASLIILKTIMIFPIGHVIGHVIGYSISS